MLTYLQLNKYLNFKQCYNLHCFDIKSILDYNVNKYVLNIYNSYIHVTHVVANTNKRMFVFF